MERPSAESIYRASWIEVRAVTAIPPEALVLLDRGEAEVIALAETVTATEVVLDEHAARAVAAARWLQSIGTASLLVRAKRQRLITGVCPYLERMQS